MDDLEILYYSPFFTFVLYTAARIQCIMEDSQTEEITANPENEFYEKAQKYWAEVPGKKIETKFAKFHFMD